MNRAETIRAAGAAVIGAGPAGSVAALLLARAGWPVTLIEQHRFPRDKVCGECLSALGIEVLTRMGLDEELRSLDPVIHTHFAIYRPDGRHSRLTLPRPMWGISRKVLDSCLLRRAVESGVKLLQPARFERLDSQPPRLRVRDLTSNQVRVLQPDQVIIADGKPAASRTTDDFGIKAHFCDVDGPRDTIELFGCDGCYGGLAAIEGNRWNAAFSVPAARLRRHRGNIDRLFAQIMRENRTLGRRLARSRQISGWLAAPLPRFAVRGGWPRDVIAVGNAAAAIEPIGGEGIGLALRSAEIAVATILARGPTQDEQHSQTIAAYRRLWRLLRSSSRAAAVIVSHPSLSRALVPLLRRSPAAARVSLMALGK